MRRGAQRIIGRGSRAWYGLWALLMVLLVMGSVYTARTAHADPAPGSMHVVVPVPSSDNKTVQGPIHANVSLAASQATAGASYQLGWANPSDGCANGFHGFGGSAASVTADDGGSFTATILWPGAAGNVGSLYLICASDTANPKTDVITADQQYQVLSAASPRIILAQAPSSTAKGKAYSAGGPVQVTGSAFVPANTSVAIYVTSSSSFSVQDLAGTPLKTADGSQIVSDDQGAFSAIVILPTSPTGQLFIHAVSTDGVANGATPFPPSLVANHTIQIGAAEATPTVQPSPTPKAAGGHNTTPPAKDHTLRYIAIATLGGLSLILFIIGGILVASAAFGPRTPPTMESGERVMSGSARSGPQW